MERIQGEREGEGELAELGVQDWARLWRAVIHELRNGLKLKKTDYTRTPVEFELTPYEILMDDIRSRRYKLNKVSNIRKKRGGRLREVEGSNLCYPGTSCYAPEGQDGGTRRHSGLYQEQTSIETGEWSRLECRSG